jgi:pimeloyl-ACP methyl ester carboxylesterase
VVVAHGAGNDALFPLAALFAALVRRGFEVFSFDLDGNGWESTTRFSVETAPGAVAAALAAASAGRPPLPVHLLGHSLGGALVLHHLGTAPPGAVASAALLSAPLSISLGPGTVVGELAGFFGRATLGQCAAYGWWGVVPAVGPLKRRDYPFRHAGAGRPMAYVDAVRALLRALELPRAAARVRVPVLLVYGGADRLVPLAQGRELAGLLPRAELETVRGGSHWSVPFTPVVVARVADWVEAHTPPAPEAGG